MNPAMSNTTVEFEKMMLSMVELAVENQATIEMESTVKEPAVEMPQGAKIYQFVPRMADATLAAIQAQYGHHHSHYSTPVYDDSIFATTHSLFKVIKETGIPFQMMGKGIDFWLEEIDPANENRSMSSQPMISPTAPCLWSGPEAS